MKKYIILFTVLALALPTLRSFGENIHPDDDRLRMLKQAFLAFAEKNGNYPRGENKDIVRQLSDPAKGIALNSRGIDGKGEILDSNGRPLEFFYSSKGSLVIASIGSEQETLIRFVLMPPFQRELAEGGTSHSNQQSDK